MAIIAKGTTPELSSRNFFGVTEYEIRKAIKLTQLIPELQSILEDNPKKLNLACAVLVADYDSESQGAFVEMCGIKGYQLNKATVQYIARKCPPPAADKQLIFAAWREARAEADKRRSAPQGRSPLIARNLPPIWTRLAATRRLRSCFYNSCGSELADVSGLIFKAYRKGSISP